MSVLSELMPKIDNIFEFLSVHREMIQDKVRTSAYKKSIFNTIKKGDVVLDVGTGTGLLAFFCAQAGASKVYAIEKTDIIKVAQENAKNNGFDNIIFINEDSRNVTLPEKVDVIVSEVIGHFVLEENMLDSIVDAKERFLKKNGVLIPESVDLYFAPVEANRFYDEEINYWNKKTDNIDFSASKIFATNNVYILDILESNYLSDSQKIETIDFYSSEKINLKIEASFKIKRSGVLHGLAGWFKVTLCENVFINTSPNSTKTHWKQCFFPLESPVHVSKGDEISIDFYSKSLAEDVVWTWEVTLNDQKCHSSFFKQSTSNLLSRSVLRNYWKNSRITKQVTDTHELLLNIK